MLRLRRLDATRRLPNDGFRGLHGLHHRFRHHHALRGLAHARLESARDTYQDWRQRKYPRGTHKADLVRQVQEATVEVDPGPLATGLCGANRPGHFRGVATVVAKLFNIVRPGLAFFGEKDYQQLVVIRAMARDLDYQLHVVGRPTVREKDGLAMSSRNAYLASDERKAATVLFRALTVAREAADGGERSGVALAALMESMIDGEPLARLDYAAVVDPDSLERLARIGHRARALVAATVGPARLIDNLALVD